MQLDIRRVVKQWPREVGSLHPWRCSNLSWTNDQTLKLSLFWLVGFQSPFWSFHDFDSKWEGVDKWGRGCKASDRGSLVLMSEKIEKLNMDWEEGTEEQSWQWPFDLDGVASWRVGRWWLHQGRKEVRGAWARGCQQAAAGFGGSKEGFGDGTVRQSTARLGTAIERSCREFQDKC